jgi:uncharacterized protein YggE
MKRILIFLGLATILVLSACMAPTPAQVAPQSAPAQQSSDAPVRNITVNGSGQVTLNPDVAYVYIGVQSQSDDVSGALSENNGKAQAIAAALSELNIASEDIQTSSFNIYPQQQYGPDGQQTATTYVVNNTVYVTVRDLSQLGRLLDLVVRSGANSINGITFDVLDKSSAISEARRLAVESAQNQAEEVAAAAGVTLGELQTMSVYFTQPAATVYEAKGGFATDASQVPLSAGQLVIRADVNASYFIR